MTAVLEMVGISKRFGSYEALKHVEFSLQSGELLGLLGRNGAGKTTTLRILLGLLRPTAGSARVLGLDCGNSIEIRRQVGYSPDEPAFHHFLTGREAIQFSLSMRGIDPDAAWSDLESIIALLDFGSQLDVFTGNYSHGMKKKLALLLAFAHRPKVLLLDEPTNGLDPQSAYAVRSLLQDNARMGVGVIVCTHVLDTAERMCSRLVILNRGSVVAQGTADDIRANAGLGKGATLEDVFMRIVSCSS